MSAKSSRKSAMTGSSSSRQGTPRESTPSAADRPRSPLSPTRVSRMAEKAELQKLNDRLVSYIEAVRALQTENSVLAKQVSESQETITRETTAVQSMYDQELREARMILDRTASDKARLEVENKRIREENEDLKSGLDKVKKENSKLETALSQAEHRFADLQPKYNKNVADLKKLHDELKEFDKTKKALENAKKHLENETLVRVDLENKLQSIKEEAEFKQQMHHHELTTLRTKRREEITEIDGRLTVQYEDKLQQALNELRDQYEQQLQSNREEILEMYETKLRNIEASHNKNQSVKNAAAEELRSLQSRYESASGKVTALESSNASLSCRLRELENQLERERTRNVQRLTEAEDELARIREEMSQQMREYQELLDIKVALDAEITAYRKLLEFEEQRLNLTPPGRNASLLRRATPQRRGTPSKRRRVLDEAENVESFQVSVEANGDIEISDADPEGKFVKLFNKGEKEIAIGGWVVKHEANNQDTVFKFHRSVKIEPKGNVTVWGMDSEHAHEPPHHILMKQKWFTGDPSTTTVVNTDGEEVARRFRQRVQSSTYSHEFQDETDQSDPPKECVLM